MIAHGYLQVTANIVFVARLVVQNMVRLTTTLSELSAQLRGVDAGKLAVDPTGPQVLMSGASFTQAPRPDPAQRFTHINSPLTFLHTYMAPW